MKHYLAICMAMLLFVGIGHSQEETGITESALKGLKFRNVGPAFTSGRIADIAIHPEDDNVWYVAVGSGGVWKTTNSGTTYKPLFDGEGSYSIGCVTLDPNNSNVVWVGSGENNNQRCSSSSSSSSGKSISVEQFVAAKGEGKESS